jgi:putative NADH-flavin reductase
MCLYAEKINNVCVFGASGGLGQQICASFVNRGISVTSVSRNAGKTSNCSLLKKVELIDSNTNKYFLFFINFILYLIFYQLNLIY